MCGRYFLALDALVVSDAFELSDWDFKPRYNIAPGQKIPLIRQGRRKQRELFEATWGLVPSWASDKKGPSLINARAESLLDKPSFRESYYQRRCIVPAQGYFEWSKSSGTSAKKAPFAVQSASGAPLAFAAIWDRWQDHDGQALTSCAIITCAAEGELAQIHPRAPVILGRKGVQRWLEGNPRSDDRVLSLLKACPESWLKVERVSSRVNSVKNDDPQCLAPQEQASLFS